ncbi:VOC family protein [Rhizobium bangladeshense]|uniref:VOC family protein n=1 Tax=Rhizobium bangladeshense TaxID=1138189 RepID=A0ABS7LBV8_9HYPH|nr:VOC family protein [Rhizobium bangladeshense]MBX4866448.1 ring-cleaving dioxygenase [Rhizobium bangladeshense]MBX4873587.1 ring-cleaving dioxygenase [Rhizobium bangladeshense]MBX4885444.1 ring-cleaving dioxygenase [Rhizobium bangladeshense]MBY3588446.1 VOC family protein [Rhizobium bangladeshense]
MLDQIKGLHHVTSMAEDARTNNQFFTHALGLRRVKKTVNFDAPDVYHLYYGDETGAPGTIMTYFPFPKMAQGRPGTGEVGTTAFSVPQGSLGFWSERFATLGVGGLKAEESFGEKRLNFSGPDGDGFALVEVENDSRQPWTHGGISEDRAIRGFHSVAMRLRDEGATAELLKFMGYEVAEERDGVKRLIRPDGNGAQLIDLETMPNIARALPGAGSVHHVAFAVENLEKQLEVRKALMDTGYQVTPVIDRDYFWAIYFRTPGGVLFEVATNEPGFDRDEDTAHLGEALKLPQQHAHLRSLLEQHLQPLEA